MVINTRNFGEIEIPEEEIIQFKDGIPGFEDLTKYTLITNPSEDVPFHWLQSVEDADLTFVVVNPFTFKMDYDFQLSPNIIERLEILNPEDVMVYSIVVIPEDITKMTANLRAPLIINTRNQLGKQILLDHEAYQTKHYILEELKKVR